MPKPNKPTWKDRVLRAFKSQDEEAMRQELEAAESEMQERDEADPYEGRFKALEDGHAAILAKLDALTRMEKQEQTGDEDPDEKEKDGEGEEEERVRTGDCAAFRDSVSTIRSRAAILAPGHELKLPTFDAKNPGAAATALCMCKRNALQAAWGTADGKEAIRPFLADPTKEPAFADAAAFDRATVDAIFSGAAELARTKNNAKVASLARIQDFGPAPKTPAQINAQNREFWAKHGAA